MSSSRRESATDVTAFNDNDEQQPFTVPLMPSHVTPTRTERRKSSLAAIFDDTRRREEPVLKHIRPNHRRLLGKHDVPYVIDEELFKDQRTLCETTLIICSWCLIILFFPFSIFIALKIVQEYERAVVFRLGRLNDASARGPGMCFILPCIDTLHLVDIRTVSFDVPPQEVLTRDSVTVAVDAVVYYRVFHPTRSISNVENAQESAHLLAQTSLRNVLGTRLLSELLCDRGAVSNFMRECLDDATDNWGIKVERVEIKDVRLPKSLQRIMAAEAEAAREARAKIIASEGEFKASNALKEAADILSQSPCAMQLRYLQTLSSIATEQNSTIIFPLPVDLMSLAQANPFSLTTAMSSNSNNTTTEKYTTITDI
ncbi:unnamed protein product [Adineta ricciae]|uniref:Band 7 domain-containing protein n=1 Tax=Adineta ricciae TaxID=249248 RepID=A0A814SDX7_ADIRI|nr:unnamed protein product [Adineta ricciae]